MCTSSTELRLTDTLITGFVQLQEHLGLLLDVAVPVLGSLHRNPVLLVHIGGEEVCPALPARPVAEPHPDISAVKRSIGFTIRFHNHREGPFMTFALATQFHIYLLWG